jgi:hypothetical protein
MIGKECLKFQSRGPTFVTLAEHLGKNSIYNNNKALDEYIDFGQDFDDEYSVFIDKKYKKRSLTSSDSPLKRRGGILKEASPHKKRKDEDPLKPVQSDLNFDEIEDSRKKCGEKKSSEKRKRDDENPGQERRNKKKKKHNKKDNEKHNEKHNKKHNKKDKHQKKKKKEEEEEEQKSKVEKLSNESHPLGRLGNQDFDVIEVIDLYQNQISDEVIVLEKKKKGSKKEKKVKKNSKTILSLYNNNNNNNNNSNNNNNIFQLAQTNGVKKPKRASLKELSNRESRYEGPTVLEFKEKREEKMLQQQKFTFFSLSSKPLPHQENNMIVIANNIDNDADSLTDINITYKNRVNTNPRPKMSTCVSDRDDTEQHLMTTCNI